MMLPIHSTALTLVLATLSPLLANPDAKAHFWDPIPASSSTTVPGEIKDDYWHGQFQRVNREVAEAEGSQLVFFGDSITWHWSLGAKTGRKVWSKRYAPHQAINMGNSGDITPVMLYRTTHGNLDFAPGQEPKVAVLLCGTNNFVVQQSAGGVVKWDLGPDCPPAEVAAGARAVAQVFRRRLPRTRVIMLGILPVARQAKWTKCREVNAINAAMRYDENEVRFVDLANKFLDADGTLNAELFTDGTHLTEEGYQVWADSIDPLIADMMQAPPLDPVKIMLIGDSVTEGLDAAGSYRRHLDGMLRRQGHLIDFVGSRHRHHNNTTAPDSYEFDPDHEGHWGRRSAWMADQLPRLLTANIPDLAVIHLGTEDIVAGGKEPEPLADDIVVNIGRMVRALRTKNPKVKIVVARIIPVRGKEEAVAMLNRKIAAFAKTQSTPRAPIITADLAHGFDRSSDWAEDGIRPTPAGAERMATGLATAIHSLISGREAPPGHSRSRKRK